VFRWLSELHDHGPIGQRAFQWRVRQFMRTACALTNDLGMGAVFLVISYFVLSHCVVLDPRNFYFLSLPVPHHCVPTHCQSVAWSHRGAPLNAWADMVQLCRWVANRWAPMANHDDLVCLVSLKRLSPFGGLVACARFFLSSYHTSLVPVDFALFQRFGHSAAEIAQGLRCGTNMTPRINVRLVVFVHGRLQLRHSARLRIFLRFP